MREVWLAATIVALLGGAFLYLAVAETTAQHRNKTDCERLGGRYAQNSRFALDGGFCIRPDGLFWERGPADPVTSAGRAALQHQDQSNGK